MTRPLDAYNEITVHVADMPEVQAILEKASQQVESLRSALAEKTRELAEFQQARDGWMEQAKEILTSLDCDEQPTLTRMMTEIAAGIQSQQDFHEDHCHDLDAPEKT